MDKLFDWFSEGLYHCQVCNKVVTPESIDKFDSRVVCTDHKKYSAYLNDAAILRDVKKEQLAQVT